MKVPQFTAAALAALALTPAAFAEDAAITVVTPHPGDVSVVRASPASLVPGFVPWVTVSARTGIASSPVRLAPATASPDASLTVAPPQTATVVYVYPTTPQTFVPVAMLPSFLVQPGAPLPAIPNYVVQSVPIPILPGSASVAAAADLDCTDLNGPVLVGAADPHHLDRNGNGIGCEPADR